MKRQGVATNKAFGKFSDEYHTVSLPPPLLGIHPKLPACPDPPLPDTYQGDGGLVAWTPELGVVYLFFGP
jgi:hypothetical protein